MEGIKLTAFLLLVIGISSAFGQDEANTELRCPKKTDELCMKNSDECANVDNCAQFYPDTPTCCNYTCGSKSLSICSALVNVTVNQECTRGTDTFPDGTTDIQTDDCNTCNCSNGELKCTNKTCPTTEPRCPKKTDELCMKNSDECANVDNCAQFYPATPTCCNYTCGSKSLSICSALVNDTVDQDCTLDGTTIKNGEVNFRLTDGCNSCNCTDGSLECTNNTCRCEYGGKMYDDGTNFDSDDGCNSCGCSRGQVICTLRACQGCEYGGKTFNSGDSFGSDDGCNTCSCSDGQISCTEKACVEPCNMNEFRECFVRMTQITFYERIASDKQWICNARYAVQTCIERNLQQCKKEIGSVMSMILKPYVAMFRTVGDIFCKRDITIGKKDRENIMRAGGCIIDFAHVAVKSSLVATCSQARASLQCVKEATHSCTDRSRNIFSMVTNVFELTISTSCKPDTCNLGMAESCINQGYIALGAPLYREQGSVLSCGWLRSTVACAFRHTMDCEEQYRGDKPGMGLDGRDNGDMKPGEDSWGKDKGDGQDMYDEEDVEMGSMESREKNNSRVKAFLEFIRRMRSKVGDMKEERLEDMEVEEEEEKDEPDSDESVCELPNAKGNCKAAFPRWFYNSKTRNCDKFIYGGCGGNGNNFESAEECESHCHDICKLPMEIGPCRAAFPRWFYNSETMSCEEFTYGGCQGNANNFEMQEACESRCNMRDNQGGRAETAKEMEDKEKQEKSVNQLDDRLDTIKKGVYKLVRKLEGKPDIGDGADPKNVLKELESQVDRLKGDVRDAMTGSVVKRNLQRLEMLKKHVDDFMEEDKMEMEDTGEDAEEMRTKLGEMKKYLETEVRHHMEDLMKRFQSIKDSIKFLTSKEDIFCMEGADMDIGDVELGLESVFLIGSLLDNPFVNKEKICRLHEKIEMSAEMKDMGEGIPRELQHKIEASFEYMRVIVGKICMPEEEEECVPVVDPEAKCDPIATNACFDPSEFAQAVHIAHRDEMYAGVCWMAEAALKCVKRNTGTCKEDEMPELAMSVRTMIGKFLGKGICKFNLGQECEPVPVCDPAAAIDQCFEDPGEFEVFCQAFMGKTFPCIKEKLAACKHSGAVTLVQIKMDDFIAQHDPNKECGIEVSLMYGDVTEPTSHCFVKMMHALKYGLKTQLTFNDAICVSQASYHECIKDKEVPSLMDYLSSRHEGFYLDFWKKNCAWMEEMGKDDDKPPEGPVCACVEPGCDNPVTPVTRPGECSCPVCPEDLSGCDLDKAVQAVAKYWFQTASVIGMHWVTDMYANYCSMDKVTAVEELFSKGLGNTCPAPAVEYLKSGLPFLRSVRDQYCPWEPKIPEGSCSLQGVKKCIEDFGQFMAQYSPRGDACGRLKQGMECVMKYAIDCDADTESKIGAEIDYLLRVSATEKCERPSWCVHDDMLPEGDLRNGVDRRKREAEDMDDEEKTALSEALANLTCSAPKVCDLMFEKCFRETTEETCMNASEVRSCIAAQLADCPLPLKVVTRTNIMAYIHMIAKTEGLNDTDSCNLIPEDLSQLDNHELSICVALLENQMNETGNVCGAMNRYTQCMRSDLSNDEIPRLYHSVLLVQMEVFATFHSDYCTTENQNTVDCALVRCANPTCNNSYIPDGGCCKVCPPDCSAVLCERPECDSPVKPQGECCAVCPEEKCPDHEKIAMNLNSLLRKTALLPYFPLANRDEMCHRGEEMFETTMELIYACPDERKEKLYEALKTFGGLIDTMGFCSKDPMPRDCDTEKAMMCVTELAHSVLEAEKSGFKHSMCSQLNRQAICVTVNTLGCRPTIKQVLEKTYWDVQSVVYKKCTPPPAPEPSMQCMAREARGQQCDVSKATQCMYKTFTELACDQPYWKMICPNVPFMSACIERHLYGCSRDEKVVVMELGDKLKSRVKGRCPQVECDVCGAERCMATLNHTTDNEGYCRDATEALRCVKSKTKHCGEDHAGELWSRMKMISQRVDQVCRNKVHYCLNNFKDTVLSLMMYKGPIFDMEKDEDKDSEEETESSESGSSKTKSAKESKESKSTKASKDSNAKSAKESKDSKSTKESKDSKSTKESKDSKSTKESKDSKSTKESKDSKAKSAKESKDSKAKSTKESSGAKTKGSSKESKVSKSKDSGDSGNSKDTYCDVIAYDGEPWWDDKHIGFLMETVGERKDMWDRDESGESSRESGESSGSASSDGGSSGKLKSGKLKSGKLKSGKESSGNEKSAKEKSAKENSAKEKSAKEKSAKEKSAKEKSAKGSSDINRTPRTECVHKRPVPLHRDLNRLCMKLYDSLRCIESHMFLLDESIRESVQIAIYGVLQTASKKCRALPLQCQSCNKANSHQECDAQGEMTCPPNKQYCITSEKLDDKGKILTVSKGCAKIDEHCSADNGRKKSCCSSPLCNKGAPKNETVVIPEPYCNLFSKTYCALSLASSLVKAKLMDCSMLSETLHCMSTVDEACMGKEEANMIKMYTKRLRQSRAWTRCLAQERTCRCGGHTVLALNTIFNPYTSLETVCRHFYSAYEIAKNLNWNKCSMEEHEFVKMNMGVAYSRISGMCLPKEPVCPEHSALSVEDQAKCSAETMCSCGEGQTCCRYEECGTLCLKIEEKTDDTDKEKDGFCPNVDGDAIGICPVQCAKDSECNGTKKCCKTACGGSTQCIEPLKDDPNKEKEGFCPLVERGAVGTCVVECGRDSMCGGKKKCCDSPCGFRQCRDPQDHQPVTCREGVKEVQCLARPCDVNKCNNIPDAKCWDNYCGGCHAQFILDDKDVTHMCDNNPADLCDMELNNGTTEGCQENATGRYYFNANTSKCEKFNFTGCGGNENNFALLRDCSKTCKPACSQQIERRSDCGLNISSWGFNSESGMCEEFMYGGCGGNKNRFNSQWGCLEKCIGVDMMNETCSKIGETLKSMTDVWKMRLQSLSKPFNCLFLHQEILPKAEMILKKCYLENKREELRNTSRDMLQFDWSGCEMEEENNSGEDMEQKFCYPFEKIKKTCFMSIDASNSTQDHCGDLQTVKECVVKMTGSCNLFRTEPINVDFKMVVMSLKEGSIDCNISLPEPPESQLQPVKDCVDIYLTTFTAGMADKFIPLNDMGEMCSATGEFRKCIYKIGELPVKHIVGSMVDIATKLHQDLCKGVPEFEAPKVETPIQCYDCSNKEDNDACNGRNMTCPFHKQTCFTEFKKNLQTNQTSIKKKCVTPAFAKSVDNECKLKGSMLRCQYVCSDGSMCNKAQFPKGEETSEPSRRRKRQESEPEVDESNSCMYKEFGMMAGYSMKKLFKLQFEHYQDYQEFCNGQEETALAVMEYRANCSSNMTKRIDTISRCFTALSEMCCPQPIRDMEEEQEQEEKEEEEEPEEPEEESACNVRKCFKPILSYFSGLGSDPECTNIPRALKCVSEKLPECNNSQILAIQSTLKTLRQIVPNDSCIDEITRAVCEARIDQDCDFVEAGLCEGAYFNAVIVTDQAVRCQNNKDQEACVNHFVRNCNASEEKTKLLDAVDELTDCPDNTNITANYDPDPCGYQWGECDPIAAARTSLEFIQGNDSENCLKAGEVKDQIVEHVSGCSSIPYTVVEAGLLSGTTCLDSIAGVIDDHPWDECIGEMINLELETMCTSFDKLLQCFMAKEPASDLDRHMMADHIKHLEAFNKTCKQPEMEIPTGGDCKPRSTAKCVLTYGMLFAMGPFMPLLKKIDFCDNYGTVMGECMKWDSCSSEHVTVLQNFFDNLHEKSGMCQEPEDPMWPCDWEMCFQTVSPFMNSVAVDGKCCHIERTVQCVRKMLPECDISQKSAIASSLKTLRGVIPNDMCTDDLSKAVCEAEKRDPECNEDKAKDCSWNYEVELTDNSTKKCTKNQNHKACVMFHASKCDNDTKAPLMQELDALSDCPEDTEIIADFDPNPCSYAWGKCDLIAAASTSLDFIHGNNSENCPKAVEVKDQILEHVSGCSSIPYTVVEAGLLSGTTCLDSIAGVTDYHPWAECIGNIMTNFPLETMCTRLQDFQTCIEMTKPTSPIHYMMAEHITKLRSTCTQPEVPIPTGEGCAPLSAARCILTHGMLFTFAPFLPNDGKRAICRQYSALTDACLTTYDSCSSAHVAVLKDFFDEVVKESKMCDEPMELECPKDPEEPEKPKCDPEMAMTFISELGISMSDCITSKKLKQEVCSSATFVRRRVIAAVMDCPDSIQYKVLASWTSLMEVVDSVCEGKKPDKGLPDINKTPVCIKEDYMNMRGKCKPSIALECLARLEQAVFEPERTETGFCVLMRYTTKCFIDYTTNCDPVIGLAVNPLMKRTLDLFSDRCPTTWCPYEEEPEMCDIDAVHSCVKQLKMSIQEDKHKSCSMVEQTKSCIAKVTVDCTEKYGLLVSKAYEQVKLLSSIACVVEKPDVDPNACIKHYKELGRKLRMVGHPNSGGDGDSDEDDAETDDSDSDDEEGVNSGSDDDDSDGGTTKSTAKDSKEKSTGKSKDSKEKSAGKSKDSKEKSAGKSKDSKEKSAGKSKDSKEKSTGKSKDSKDSKSAKSGTVKSGSKSKDSSRGSWTGEVSREYENTVKGICLELEAAWKCVETTLNTLTLKRKTVVSMMINEVKQTMAEKCKPMHCYTCNGLGDNGDCNNQPTFACPTDKLMCMSKYDDGKYEKRCAGPDECEECKGKENCYCCNGHKCNVNGTSDEPEKCDVNIAIDCAFDLIFATMATDKLQLSLIKGDLQCIIEHTKGCKTKQYYRLYTVCVEIEILFELGTCVSDYGDPRCGTVGILSLDHIRMNPYREYSLYSVCRQYEATSDMVSDIIEGDETCSATQLDELQTAFQSAEQQLSGVCVANQDPPHICDTDKALTDCLQNKIWLREGASECSPDMLSAFKNCCIEHTKGCNSALRSTLISPVDRFFDELPGNCADDHDYDRDALFAEIFAWDELSVITDEYVNFISKIQDALIFGSLNFIEDLCIHADELKSALSGIESSQLQSVSGTNTADTIQEQLGDVCVDTNITDEDVKKECKGKKIDMVLVLDSSGSIGPPNFELVRNFALDAIRLADLESSSVRLGLVQFASEAKLLFGLKDYMTEINGTLVQNKTNLLNIVKNMNFTKGETYTASAIKEARNELVLNGRQNASQYILIFTDGEPSEEGSEGQAEAAWALDIKVFVVAVGQEPTDSINAIASRPAAANILYLKEFEQLEVFYKKIFKRFCQESTVSECDYVELVYQSCTALLSSMTSSYATIGQTSSVCRKIDSIYNSVTTLSATCANHQQNALKLIQSLYIAQSRETCLHYRTDEFDQTCDIYMAKMCVSDMAQFLSSARFYEDTVCSKISTTVDCLNYYAPSCEDKTAILKEIDYSLLILMNRCPDELVSLRCWATDESSENKTETPTGTDRCDIPIIATECALDLGTFNLGGDLCGALLLSAQTAFDCAFEKFKSVLCPVDQLKELKDYFLGEVKTVLETISLGSACILQEDQLESNLPEGYGVIESRTCEVMPVCNLTAAAMCLNSLSLLEEGCSNWADVEKCYNDIIAKCNPRERIVFQREMAAFARNIVGISDDCLGDFETLEGVCVIQLETENNCDMYTGYIACLEQLTAPMSEISSHSRILDHFNAVLNGYCSEAPVVEDPTDSCAVTDLEIKCVNDYVYRVTNALYLSQSGKERLCETYKVSDLGCFSRKYSCSAGQPHGWLWERYRIAKAYLHFSDVCSKTPFICSTRFAYSCITNLSVAVTEYDYSKGDSSKVCRQLQQTRSCLRQTLTACDLYQQQSMMTTFKDIECLAKDICTTDNWEEPDPDGKPVKCFDKALVTEDSPCKPMRAKECISNFEWEAKNPFATNQKAANLAYSDLLPCVYTNVAKCGTATTGLVLHYLEMTLLKYKDWNFPTVMRSPCEEETDCKLTAAKACVTKFIANLDTYRKDGSVCQNIEYVQVCIKSSKDSCSDAAIVEIDAMYKKMVEDADTDCTEDFFTCANTYISYANKILQWKSCIPEETEETDEETEETEPDTEVTQSTGKTKSKEKSTAKSATEKSTAKSATEKSTAKSATEKSTAKSKKRRRRSEESEAKSEKSKTAKSEKSKTAKSEKSKTAKSATPRETTETDDNLDLVNLRRMCTVFINAWTCVQTRWDSLDGTIRTVVKGTFSAYHNSVMDICNGPKPGFCNKGGYRDGMEGCQTDLECNSKQKCCNLGETAACVNPKDFGQDCCEKFQITSKKVLKVVKSFYLGTDNNQEFCRLYSEEKVAIEASLSLSCPVLYFKSIKVSWEAAFVAYEKYCLVTPPPPTVCDTETAQICIDNFNDVGTSNEERCNGYSELVFCLRDFFTECDNTKEADQLIIAEVTAKLRKINESLLCADIPDVVLSNTCESTIVIKEGQMPGDKIEIKLAQNPAELCNGGSVCEVHIETKLTEPKNKLPKCSNGQSIPQLLIGNGCNLVFTSDNWNKTQPLILMARTDLKKDGDFTAKLKINAILFVDDVQVLKKPVQKCVVLVRDEDTNSMCSSVNDPHMRTFDKLKYDNMVKGESVLYRHRTLPYEVRTLLTKCKWKKKKASCNCGVSVKAGDDTFVLTRCNGKTEEIMHLNSPLTENFRILKGEGGQKYTVVFPHGTRVFIQLEKSKILKAKGEAKLINIFIAPVGADKGQVLGMCGNYDGDPDNDIHHRDGTVITGIDLKDYTADWAKVWKMTSDYLFLGVNADPFIEEIDSVCAATGQQCGCDLSELVETCELDFETDISLDATIVRTGAARRKRAVGDPFAALGIDDVNEPVELAVFPTESGITFEMANETCYNELTSAAFADSCTNIVDRKDVLDRVDGCIEDTKFMDGYEFLQSAINALSKDCEEAAKTSTNTSLINDIKNVTCPSQCSGHGACVNSSCECDDGFRSADCSIDISVPPLLEDLSLTLCQPTPQEDCVSVTLNGDDFISEAVCHLQIVQITNTGINKTGSIVKNVPAQWISLEQVTCDLTQSGSMPLHAVLVSVSNNGQVTSQSEQLLYVAHNPTCFSCTQPNQTEGTCIKQRASCFVDGQCYGPLEPSQSDPCYICNVNTQQMMYNISDACPPATTTEEPYIENEKARQMNDSLVIGLSAGAAGLVLVIIVIVVMVMFMRHMSMKSKRSDTKELTHRSSSGRSSEDGEGFGELVYPAFANYGYQGYPGQGYPAQGYPAMYLEAPQDLFVDNIPKRHSSRQSDPTRDRHDRGEHRRSGHRQEDYYDNRQSSRS